MFDSDKDLRLENLTERMDKDIFDNKKKGFKSNNRIYRKVFNKVLRESKSIDQFGEDYFCSKKEDETIPVCVTLPRSLVVEIDKYRKAKKLTRSRLFRKVLTYSLNLKKTD